MKLHMIYVKPGKRAPRRLCDRRVANSEQLTPKREAVSCQKCLSIVTR